MPLRESQRAAQDSAPRTGLVEGSADTRKAWLMPCRHLTDIDPIEPNTVEGCEECLEIGGQWVHLRLCMACGHVGCCDNSPNRHATGHFHETGHGVIQSFEPGERWAYCYVDEDVVDPVPEIVNRSYR